MIRSIPKRAGWSLLFVVALFAPETAAAHCDTMDGPVVTAARIALERGDVKPVLEWVSETDEPEIRTAFEKTLTVRKLGSQGRELADLYFFETLVRLHRAGEGIPYTGLKPAGTVEPAVALADEALDRGTVDALVQRISAEFAAGLRARFEHAIAAKKQADSSVQAGREYVAAYVDFIHYAERLHLDATTAPGHHAEASAASLRPDGH